MRVNVYAEEMTDRVEIITKDEFTGVRFYLYLPVTVNVPIYDKRTNKVLNTGNYRGPFIHKESDDDSSAVTFWGKRDLRDSLQKAIQLLDEYYRNRA